MIRKKGHNWTSGRRDRDAWAEGGRGGSIYSYVPLTSWVHLNVDFFPNIYFGKFFVGDLQQLEKLTDEPRSVGIPKGIKKQVLL